ncbi:hypothetical protein NMG60_11032338 [Bertholletia excelsa]
MRRRIPLIGRWPFDMYVMSAIVRATRLGSHDEICCTRTCYWMLALLIVYVSVVAEKGKLTVIGDVDPVLVAKQVRKARKEAEILRVGKPKSKCLDKCKDIGRRKFLPRCCRTCEVLIIDYTPYSVCSIL